jgi:hypothetical protein
MTSLLACNKSPDPLRLSVVVTYYQPMAGDSPPPSTNLKSRYLAGRTPPLRGSHFGFSLSARALTPGWRPVCWPRRMAAFSVSRTTTIRWVDQVPSRGSRSRLASRQPYARILTGGLISFARTEDVKWLTHQQAKEFNQRMAQYRRRLPSLPEHAEEQSVIVGVEPVDVSLGYVLNFSRWRIGHGHHAC